MATTISYQESLTLPNVVYVDVRSPSEFSHDHIPRALNYPLFTDNERSHIGTLYQVQGKEIAIVEGVSIVSPKLKDIVTCLFDLSKQHHVIVYCYRGGMRSESIVSICNALGYNLYKLQGGYKEYRKYVRTYLETYVFNKPIFTLYGLAGSGKTKILQHLSYAIDLEQCAGNRSSVFGFIGMPNYTQKYFESLLVDQLHHTIDWPYCVFEGESRKIGNCHIPQCILLALKSGIALWLETPLEQRIQHIYEEYVPYLTDEIVFSALKKLEPQLGKYNITHCKKLYTQGKIHELIEFLLLHHYDPEYMHTLKHIRIHTRISYKDPISSATEIESLINTIIMKQ